MLLVNLDLHGQHPPFSSIFVFWGASRSKALAFVDRLQICHPHRFRQNTLGGFNTSMVCQRARSLLPPNVVRKLDKAVSVSGSFGGSRKQKSGKIPGTLSRTLPSTLSAPFVQGFFLKSTVAAFSSFSDLERLHWSCGYGWTSSLQLITRRV